MRQEEVVVSVIVLTYNHEKYIRQALDGILMQKTSFRYEVLVGDDASTDGTSDIVREYAVRFPGVLQLYAQERNVGVSRNAYELLTVARGVYLATCEGDDYWTDSSKLQIQFDFLESHPGCSACTHDITIVGEDGKPQKNQKLEWISRYRRYTIGDFKGIFLPGQGSSMMRRNFFLEPSFDGTVLYKANRMIADRTIALLWAAHGDIYRLSQNMACYRNVLSKDSTNVTMTLYTNNPNRVRDDFKYTLFLERYATETLGLTVDFDYHKQQLLIGAMAEWIARREKLNLASEILCSIRRPLNIIWSCLVITIKKMYYRILKRREKRG